jgi:hypothetical protein
VLHDNAPAHNAGSVCQFLTPKNVTTLHHPQYSPYLLFPKLKKKFKGLHFADVAGIQEAVTVELKKVQKEEISAAFRNCPTAQKSVYMPMDLF